MFLTLSSAIAFCAQNQKKLQIFKQQCFEVEVAHVDFKEQGDARHKEIHGHVYTTYNMRAMPLCVSVSCVASKPRMWPAQESHMLLILVCYCEPVVVSAHDHSPCIMQHMGQSGSSWARRTQSLDLARLAFSHSPIYACHS